MRALGLWSIRRTATSAPRPSGVQIACKRWSGGVAADSSAPLSHEVVWGLWNEGNLFSLTVAQMDAFLTSNRVTPDGSRKKAMLVRQLEELLQRKENQEKGLPPPQQAPPPPPQRGHGAWAPVRPVSEPETLLDLTQTGFYESPHAMAPKAFQLLVSGAAPDVVVSRVNTTAFPGFPANSECYTLSSADANLSLRTRFSKAFQWCVMNLSNLRIDAEFQADFGKLLVNQSMLKKNRQVVSAYSFQQRIQTQAGVTGGSQWVSAVSEASVPAMEALLADELFTAVGRKQVSYEAHIRRAADTITVELNNKAQATAVNNIWTNVQTSHLLQPNSVDSRLMLRTRQPLRRQEVELYSNTPILKLENEDISVVLPAEHGQVAYVSENEVRRWEKRNTISGARLAIIETRREPLIVVRDEEEDVRLEYQMVASVPCTPTEKVDLRLLSLELYDLSKLFAETLGEDFTKSFGCTPAPVTATTLSAPQA